MPMSAVRALARAVSRIGLDGNRVLAAAEASPATEKGFVSDMAVGQAIADLARENAIEHMGLALAQSFSFSGLGSIDYHFSTSATLIDAFINVSPHLDAVGDMRVEMAINGGEATFRVHHTERPGAEEVVAIMCELDLAAMVCRIRDVLGDEVVQIHAVRFSHMAPPSTTAYERFFRASVAFGTTTGFDEIVVPLALLHAPLLTADPVLAEALRERTLGKRVDQPADAFSDRIRAVIQSSLSDGEPALGVDVIAAQLEMSGRALQRRLKERELSLSALIDERRRAVAETLLSRKSVLLCDVAGELGFRDVKAFSRAFRRWTGTSPRAFHRARAASD
jgi:AraC-like DNA-binding protein